jgi:hypothetical protein
MSGFIIGFAYGLAASDPDGGPIVGEGDCPRASIPSPKAQHARVATVTIRGIRVCIGILLRRRAKTRSTVRSIDLLAAPISRIRPDRPNRADSFRPEKPDELNDPDVRTSPISHFDQDAPRSTRFPSTERNQCAGVDPACSRVVC